jgi:hypothetical protein
LQGLLRKQICATLQTHRLVQTLKTGKQNVMN